MTSHKCPSNVMLAAIALNTVSTVTAHEATYAGLRCPECGMKTRNTRLAGTMWELKHKWGWDIETIRADGLQAEYLLKRAGTMPKQGKPVLTVVPPSDLPHWTCTGVLKKTLRRPKALSTHEVAYPEQPLQPSTDVSGGFAFSRCRVCNETTVWTKVKTDGPDSLL